MNLTSLIDGIHVKSVSGTLETEIDGVCFDSREAKPGSVFFALKGVDHDGHDFIGSAIENGASAVVAEIPYPADTEATWIHVGNSRRAMALASANFNGNPSSVFPVVGITGTNGKTTTALLTHYLMEANLRRVGMIGTIGYVIGDEHEEATHTTPESPQVQGLLKRMVDADCRGAVMEVSSHAIAQERVSGVHFDVGVFTNLSQDHLDFHGTMDAYFEAKELLFRRMTDDGAKKGAMIVNCDDKYGERLLKARGFELKVITFGQNANADFKASDIKFGFDGTTFKLSVKGRQFLVKTPLIGLFNVYNTLSALASVYSIGLNLREAIANMANSPQVPGRLEQVRGAQTNYRVFVDYAHTPDALENALTTVRALNPNRIITVFGCGGDRDRGKRPQMAEKAEEGSDFSILTSDNPRTEDPERILRETKVGFEESNFEVVPDRREAIYRAIELSGEKDIVLIAGKGHETYQEIEGVRHDFDDRKVAYGAMAAKAERGEV